MFRVITVEREYGCGAAEIARELAQRLGWRLWDQNLTQEIAKLANVDPKAVARCDEHVDSTIHRLGKVFWRGSYERSLPIRGIEAFDTDRMVALVQEVIQRAAAQGNCVVVGRGAPYFLRERADAFHVFLYAPRAEKMRRIRDAGKSEEEAEELLDTVDRDRIAFIKHYFNADWPTRALYHLMINTTIGDARVVDMILEMMRSLQASPAPV